MNNNPPSDTANYYQENKEHMKASALEYKANNKQKIKETNKIYRNNYNKLIVWN
mgnify:CR=1 FL=1